MSTRSKVISAIAATGVIAAIVAVVAHKRTSETFAA